MPLTFLQYTGGCFASPSEITGGQKTTPLLYVPKILSKRYWCPKRTCVFSIKLVKDCAGALTPLKLIS